MRPPLSNPGWQIWPGAMIAVGLLGLSLAGLGALLWQSPGVDIPSLWHSSYLRGVIGFSFWQAIVSVALSLLAAIPVARALDRHRNFPGRGLLLRLMELSLVLPTIVAVSGLVAIYGRQGWLTPIIGYLAPALEWNLYGLPGIVLAHVFFNAPLAARILLQSFENMPPQQRKLASQLGLGSLWLWRTIEWPAIRSILPGLAGLIFTLCFTSFAIVMTLGGGPSATTLEVAIYQALRFEFDFGRAALLALVQLLVCGSLWWIVVRHGTNAALMPNRVSSEHPVRRDSTGISQIFDSLLLPIFAAFLILPLAAIVWRGMPGLLGSHGSLLLAATARSFAIALPAGALSVAGALLILAASGSTRSPKLARLCEMAAHFPLIVPAIVMGTGLFLLLRPSLGTSYDGFALVALINAFMALPFILHMLRGPLLGLDGESLKVADQLNIRGWYRWRWLHWPRLRMPLALAMAYGAGLSLGDFGVIALFGTPAQPTLPVLLYQQLGSYQISSAAGTGLWIIGLLLANFGIFNLLGRSPRPNESHHA